ncbi:MAG TPA: hypothetical protein VG870_07745 [Chitinophagaceae bacterium]|nr:hypothetical protein [Chitinophagaceae bacterium]
MLQKSLEQTLDQLTDSLNLLEQGQYVHPCQTLFQASIGQHVRHIIELFQCLQGGYEEGVVNYDRRKRDVSIEKDPQLAACLLRQIRRDLVRPEKTLWLACTYGSGQDEPVLIPTNYHRELVYNLEHTIHHMALIRIGFRELAAPPLPDDYGVAPSTVKYRQSCAP